VNRVRCKKMVCYFLRTILESSEKNEEPTEHLIQISWPFDWNSKQITLSIMVLNMFGGLVVLSLVQNLLATAQPLLAHWLQYAEWEILGNASKEGKWEWVISGLVLGCQGSFSGIEWHIQAQTTSWKGYVWKIDFL
jgi:hypothetical protein